VIDYTRHTPYTDPGPHAALLDALPADAGELMAVVRNVIMHYRASGVPLGADRLAEIDNRWLDRILDVDQRRFGVPLDVPRPEAERVAGCCRDFTLLTVAALRQRGVPARSRVGFASYFEEGFHHDHVVVEYFDGERWVWADAQIAPDPVWGFDPGDVPRPSAFASAADVWTAHRRGEIDVDRYGVSPDLPLRGEWFACDEVLIELAHRMGDELLLWDVFGAMADPTTSAGHDARLVDEIAALLLAADAGDEAAERELAERYAADPRLHPGERVLCYSPTGHHRMVDLRTRTEAVTA
jgi:hypothetical protein